MIVIASTFTADVMYPQLLPYLAPTQSFDIHFVYKDIFPQLLLAHSAFKQNHDGLNILLIRLSDLISVETPSSEQFVTEFVYAIKTGYEQMQVPLFVLLCPPPGPIQSVYAHFAQQIQDHLHGESGLSVIQVQSSLKQIDSPLTDQYGHLPYLSEFYNELSHLIIEKLYKSPIPKSQACFSNPARSLADLYQDPLISRHLLGLCRRYHIEVPQVEVSLVSCGLDSLGAHSLSQAILQVYPCFIPSISLLDESCTLDYLHRHIIDEIKKSLSLKEKSEPFKTRPFLSSTQLNSWLQEKKPTRNKKNHLFCAYELPLTLDKTVLERSLHTWLNRHDTLRLSFSVTSTSEFNCPLGPLPLLIEYAQIEDTDFISYCEQFYQYPFTLEQAPLVRFAVVSSSTRVVLLFCAHTLIFDDWSLGILEKELSVIYQAYAQHIAPQLPILPYQFIHTIDSPNNPSNSFANQKQYWQTFLAKLPMMALIDPNKEDKEFITSFSSIDFEWNAMTYQCLKHLAAEQETTLFQLISSAFGLWLAACTNQSDVCFLTSIAGREAPFLNHLVGGFTKRLVVRFPVQHHLSWIQLLQHHKKIWQKILAHQDLPLQDILAISNEKLAAKLLIYHLPTLVFHSNAESHLELENTICKKIKLKTELHDHSDYLICTVQENEFGLQGNLTYNRSFFKFDTINDMAQHFQSLVNQIAQNSQDLCKNLWFPSPLRFACNKERMIMLEGYSIDPTIIEFYLTQHTLVNQAIVLANRLLETKTLAAYILLKPGHQLSEINLYQHLKSFLPEYMLPETYYQITHIPLNETGDLNKQEIMTTFNLPIVYRKFEASQNTLQEQIMHIFADILTLDPSLIDIDADFLDLGGTSLSALRLIHILNDRFHVSIHFSIIYAHASVKSLSDKITELLNKTQFASLAAHYPLPQHALKQIKKGNPEKLPLIFIHPLSGTGCCYLDLIKSLPEDQPCYLIQDPSIDAQHVLFDNMNSMAHYYNHILLKHNPGTSCILAGYAFGALLAIEMVKQLEEKNLAHCVHSLIALDLWVNLQSEEMDKLYVLDKISKKIVLFNTTDHHTQAIEIIKNTFHTASSIDTHIIPCEHDSLLQWPQIRIVSQLINQYIEGNKHAMA